MAGTANSGGIYAWDNDVAPWTTITVEVELRYEWELDNGPQIDPLEDDSYKTQWKGTATFDMETLTFSREDPEFDDFVQSANAFALIRGLGGGTGQPPDGWQTRSVFCVIAGSAGAGAAAPFVSDRVQTMDVPWEINYIRVGPDTGGSIPPGESGTASGGIYFNLLLSQDSDELLWSSTAFMDADIPSFVPLTWGVTSPSGGGSPPIKVFVHNLKTDPGDNVDIGAVIAWVTDTPDSALFNITTFDVGVTVTVTCS